MSDEQLSQTIDECYARIDTLQTGDSALTEIRSAVEEALAGLDSGRLRVAEKHGEVWVVNEWIKKAVLLSFVLTPSRQMSGAPDNSVWWDKVPPKFAHWDQARFEAARIRAVPGAVVRHGSYIAPQVVLMPSFVNIGAYVGEGTMVDTWATIGSCAQVGAHCHISGGTGIAGVLEPLQDNPVIIEDNCFIGARSEVAEGVIIGEGSVLSMGVFITASTKIVNRETGEITRGVVPPYSVVVPGALPGPSGAAGPNPSLYCAVIVKTVDAGTRAKTSVNDLLRDA